MKLYLSSSIIDTRQLSAVSFIKETYTDSEVNRIELFYSNPDVRNDYSAVVVASTDLEADKKLLTKYFKNIEKQGK